MEHQGDGARRAVEEQLKGITQTLLEMSIIVHGFEGPQTTEVLVSKINALVDEYRALDESRRSLSQTVPMDIVSYIEEGRNPDVYTREFVELLQKQNQFVNGKFQAMRVGNSLGCADDRTSGLCWLRTSKKPGQSTPTTWMRFCAVHRDLTSCNDQETTWTILPIALCISCISCDWATGCTKTVQ